MIVKVLVSTFVVLFALVAADVSELLAQERVSQQCLGCICEAATKCNTTVACQGDVCGPFGITWGYWSDAGKPTLGGQSEQDTNAYPNCVNDAACAGRTVRAYMDKFGQDCNGDGKVDCDDFVRVHFLGGYGCSGNLQQKNVDEYNECRSHFPN